LPADGRVGLGDGEGLGGRAVGIGVDAAGDGDAGTLAVTVALEHAACVISAATNKPTKKGQFHRLDKPARLT
jgi:hypothetical protein